MEIPLPEYDSEIDSSPEWDPLTVFLMAVWVLEIVVLVVLDYWGMLP